MFDSTSDSVSFLFSQKAPCSRESANVDTNLLFTTGEMHSDALRNMSWCSVQVEYLGKEDTDTEFQYRK